MSKHDLCDSVTTIITDDNYFLCLVDPEDACVVSLITSRVPADALWKDIITRDVKEILREDVHHPNNVYKIVRIWVPVPTDDSYVINIIHQVKVSTEFKNIFVIPTTGKYTRLKWLNERELIRFYNLRAVDSPILGEFFPRIRTDILQNLPLPPGMEECSNFVELTSEALTQGTGNEYIDKMLDEISPPTKELKQTYITFLKMIFPYTLMAAGHLVKYLLEVGFSKLEALHIFRAADITGRQFISFREYLGITVAMDPKTKHVGAAAHARTFYIFRYLNQNTDGKLNLKELRELVLKLRKNQQLPFDSASIERDLKEIAITLNITPTHAITCQEFVNSAGESRIRGLPTILRTGRPTIKQPQLSHHPSTSGGPKKSSYNFIPTDIEQAINAPSQEWEMATHVTIVDAADQISIKTVFDCDMFSETDLADAGISVLTRSKSLERLSTGFVCNELLEYVRELAKINSIQSGNRGNKHRDYVWGDVNAMTYAQKLLQAAALCREILSKEDRLLILDPPMYILGDFHGNFGDMLYFEKMFWPLTPLNNPASLLFLGDYVDRGWYSVEVCTYLICHKVMFPDKFFLVRGNHEMRAVQMMYSFLSECIAKFGESLGKQVWEGVNTVFDYMPLAALVDKKLFCCHGGIPPPWLCPAISAINQIPKPLPDPDNKCPLAWDLMWNDPIKEQDISKEMMLEMQANEGFAANVRRGTAHVFSEVATKKFLEANNFTHIIRAHELAMAGFNIFHEGMVITVFSSSKYNSCNNEAACLLVDSQKLQIIRLDPSNLD